MKIALPVVIKKEGKWYQGFLEDDKFTENKEIKSLSDVKNVSDYKTITAHIISIGEDRKIAEELLEKTGFESIYVLNKPVDLSVNQLKAYLWSDYYPLCKTCKKKCKQSHIVKSLHCDQYTKA
jgi:hypothetical protein